MNSLRLNYHFTALALLLTGALLVGYSIGGDHSTGATRALFHPSDGTSILQADGVGPVPLPPPPPKLQTTTASSRS